MQCKYSGPATSRDGHEDVPRPSDAIPHHSDGQPDDDRHSERDTVNDRSENLERRLHETTIPRSYQPRSHWAQFSRMTCTSQRSAMTCSPSSANSRRSIIATRSIRALDGFLARDAVA